MAAVLLFAGLVFFAVFTAINVGTQLVVPVAQAFGV